MDGRTIVASIVVGILGLVSTVIGLILEFSPVRTQARLFYFTTYECVYFRSPAFFMVVAAIVCLVVALIILSVSADCGCGRGSNTSSCSRVAVLNFVLCWLMCLAAIILFLLAGATHYGAPFFQIGDSPSLSDTSEWINTGHCYRARRGVFGATAALSFVGVTLGIISCIALVTQDSRRRPYQARRGTSSDFQQHTSL